MKSSAIYPGSFDPFTRGHLDVILKAAPLFDRIVVIIGINSSKKRCYPAEAMKSAIEKTLQGCGIDNCDVVLHEGLVAAYAADHNIGYMIRGLRNTTDYNYEENIAEINKLINPRMEYVYFRASNIGISSSMVRELTTYHMDISDYVPEPVFSAMQKTDL